MPQNPESRFATHLRTFAPSHLRTFAPSHLRTFAPSHLRTPVPPYLRTPVPSPDLERRKRHQRAHDPHDPEADDHLALVPPDLLEVVVQRGHPEHAAAGAVA